MWQFHFVSKRVNERIVLHKRDITQYLNAREGDCKEAPRVGKRRRCSWLLALTMLVILFMDLAGAASQLECVESMVDLKP